MKPILTISIVLVFSCSADTSRNGTEARSTNIPEDAFYVKGKSSGYWCQADIHSHRNNAIIKVYDASNGKLLLDKRFSVICKLEGNPIWIDDLKAQIDFFDGESFHLKRPDGKDSCWMQY